MPPKSLPVYRSGALEIDLGLRQLRAQGRTVAIGSRAFEILAVLVEAAGDLVTKDALIGKIWPGAVVEENTLQVHISAVRRALGAHRGALQTSFGRGYRLTGEWSIGQEPTGRSISAQSFAPPRGEAFQCNLPLAGSGIIGRASAIEQVLDRVSAYRVTTLTGPGGIGKTKLALEVARKLQLERDGDVCLVELGALSEPGLVASVVAGVLGLQTDGTEAAIARAIGDRRLLLVLDNCEHVLDVTARLAEEIVRRCPFTTILATSRELMRVDGECTFGVPPLDVPPKLVAEPEGAWHSAVQLLVDRVQALRSDFSLTVDDYQTAAAICRRLDGIPLALEFAAARVATLGLEHVLSRLDDRFGMLKGGRRAALPRHKTLRATLDWSYELLTGAEQRLFRRLGVFAGSFEFDAVLAIMPASEDPAQTSNGIAELVAKSLLTPDGSSAAPRWRLLETVRAFANEKLAVCNESGAIAHLHAAFYGGLFAPEGEKAEREDTPTELKRYESEIDNVRAALDWSFSSFGDPAIGVRLTAAYASIWLRLSLLVECRERTERALRYLEQQPLEDARLTVQLAIALSVALLHSTGAEDKTFAILSRALGVAEELADDNSQLRALWALWSYQHNRDHRLAHATAEKFARIAHRTGNQPDMLVGDRLLGAMAHYAGEQPKARHYIEGVIERYVEPTGHRHTQWFHHDQRVLSGAILARILWLQGSLEKAREIASECVAAASSMDHKLSLCYVLGEATCPLQIWTGDLAAAERSLAIFTDVVAKHGASLWKGLASALYGLLKVKKGDFASGVQILQVAVEAASARELMIRKPEFLGALAEGLAGAGRTSDALAAINDAIALADRDQQQWFAPELLRIKGELLHQSAEHGARALADDCFSNALAMANRQGALFWELRTAVSYARTQVGNDRRTKARDILAAVYDRFTEGFSAPELQTAKRLLTALP